MFSFVDIIILYDTVDFSPEANFKIKLCSILSAKSSSINYLYLISNKRFTSLVETFLLKNQYDLFLKVCVVHVSYNESMVCIFLDKKMTANEFMFSVQLNQSCNCIIFWFINKIHTRGKFCVSSLFLGSAHT